MTEMKKYYQLLNEYGDENSYFFSIIKSNNKRNKVAASSLNYIFRKWLKECKIKYKGGHKGPRIHDFRYTFVVKTIKKLITEGKDLNVYLPILSKYLGHSNLSDTLYYYRPKYAIFDEDKYKCKELIPKLNKDDFYDE